MFNIRKNLVKINNVGFIKFFFTCIWLLDWYFTVETITFGNFLTTHNINTYIIKILLKQKKTLLIIYIIMWYSICSITIQNLYRGMKFVFRQQLRCNIFRLFIVTTPTLSSMEIAGIICNGDVLRYILIFTTIFHKD